MRTLVAIVLLTATVSAQRFVEPAPDWASYGTALVNPTVAAVEAWRSNDRACRFGRLALSEAVGNATVLILKHGIISERPCFACEPDGIPSGHTMNSTIGASSWRYGFSMTLATGGLRVAAHRHTWQQVVAGAAIGAAADGVGRLVRCQ